VRRAGGVLAAPFVPSPSRDVEKGDRPQVYGRGPLSKVFDA
jgi:hypothetical protein